MADRPNFFELLDIDPQEVSWPEIERRIKEKKGAWARESTMGSPKKRQEARRNLVLLPEILKVLQDPRSREQEAEDALRRRGSARQAQEKKLEEWLELLRDSGTCSAEQLGRIRGQFAGTFSEQEIRARLEAAGIRVETEPASPKPPRERTDFVTAKDIRQNLELVSLTSLYDFLGLSPNSSAEELRSRAEAIQKEIHGLGRTDVETAARSRLAGTCRTLFQSEEEKKKYDNHRLLEAVEAIEAQLQAVAAEGVLSAQKLETLIRLAAQRGVPPDEIREVLEERAAQEGWEVERAPAGPPSAPARLIVRPISGGLRLSWEPVRLSGIRYRVLRKAGSVPWDEGDGTLVAQTGEIHADDAGVAPAVPWHYAVFSLKDGLASSVPAHSGPHLVTMDGAESSRHIGGLRIRRLAAAGLTTLALGGGAALFWGHSPLGLLASVFAGKSSSQAAKVPASNPQGQPASAPQGSQGNPASNGTGGAQGISTNASQTARAPSGTAPVSQPAAPPPIRPVAPPPSPVPPSTSLSNPGTGSSFANGSGGTGSSSSVLADSANRVSTTKPKPVISLPANPEVAVVAVGDPLLASPLEDELEKALGNEGIGVVSGSPALDSLRRHRASSPTISDILDALRADGVHAVVIAQVERGGDRELSYYGRKDVSSSSRVKIFAYLVNGHRALSPGWSDQVDYTSINASAEGENAAHRAAGDLADAVRNGWR